MTYSAWRDEELTQVAVAWVLGSVFVRFLEDNELIDTPYLAGPGSRLQRAKDEHEMFFRKHPTLTEREYFEKVFTEVGMLPTMKELFDRKHNPLWQLAPSGDAAKELLDFWRKTDPDTGILIYDFTDPDWNTRFLGDLYQDLSVAAQKKFALLQTPDFVEQFILDRTLTPAIQMFGYQVVRMIDPTCGSGHFLLDGFQRLFRLWQEHQPGENPRVLAQKALDGIYGVDLNPYAVAIARFRLLLVALKVCSVKRLRGSPDFHIHLAVGDSLLHGQRFREFESHRAGSQRTFDTEEIFRDELKHHYEVEDLQALHRILGQQYHAVAGNPPYITVKDKALSQAYRNRFDSCHGKYSLVAPFMERFFELALKGDGKAQEPAGYVGMITANSFMKREFGKKLIEEFIPKWDLTHVIDTSGAYIPGHGTPTVIILGKHRPPIATTIRTVMGVKGEPAVPERPAQGLVWTAILTQVDKSGSHSEFISVGDTMRESFHTHPWSIGGGGAAELKEFLDGVAENTLGELADSIGITCFTLEDDVYLQPKGTLERHNLDSSSIRPVVEGDNVREWVISECEYAVWPYDSNLQIRVLPTTHRIMRFLWPYRTRISNNLMFGGKTKVASGLKWYEFGRLTAVKLKTPLALAFGEVASHNHFVLDRGGKVFSRSANVLKLPQHSSESDYLAILGLVNSSIGCFWLKQVSTCKGLGGQGGGIKPEQWHRAYVFNATKLWEFPVPSERPAALTQELDRLAEILPTHAATAALATPGTHTRTALDSARHRWTETLQRMMALQEELDWNCYSLYELTGDNLVLPPERVPGLQLGERAFEIVMARKMEVGELETKWFEIHRSTPVTELPKHWPKTYRELVQRRIALIESNAKIALIEQPEYKRRWNVQPWNEQFERAAREWMLNRLEGYFFEGNRVCESKDGFDPARHGFTAALGPHLVTTNRLAEVVQNDAKFLEVAELYYGSSAFSVQRMARDLIENESVPYIPMYRYRHSGLRVLKDWEATWELQRKEDAIEVEIHKQCSREPEDRLKILTRKAHQEHVGNIPVPPKYASQDFQKSSFWRLRGKLDVPKERWVSYPGAERDGDPSPLIAWAGWDHLQQAQALAEYYLDAKSNQGWPERKLKMLLAGLLELLPWLKQWHNEMDPDYGMGLGDYFEGFIDEECRALGLTIDEVNEARYSGPLDA